MAKSLHESEIKGLKSKGLKVNAFQALCYQKEAHMSERDIDITQKLVKKQVGSNILAGRRLKKKASDQTMPTGILVDDFKAHVTLQAGLNKTVERLVKSNLIPLESKSILKTDEECTLYTKSGQDGTTGEHKHLCAKKGALYNSMCHVCEIFLQYVTPCDSSNLLLE